MQSKISKFCSKFSVLLVLSFLFLFFAGLGANVKAQSTDSPGEITRDNRDKAAEIAKIEESLKNCPDSIRENYVNNATEGVLDPYGTYIVGYGPDGAITLSCPDSTAAEKLIIRLFVFLTSIVGAVFTFATGKSAILMITAFENQEAFQEALKALKTSILAVLGVFFAYVVIVFVITGIMGIGGGKSQYNIVCQQRIVFSLTLDNPNLKCDK